MQQLAACTLQLHCILSYLIYYLYSGFLFHKFGTLLINKPITAMISESENLEPILKQFVAGVHTLNSSLFLDAGTLLNEPRRLGVYNLDNEDDCHKQ